MKVHSEKRRELTQTMTSLSAAIRLEEGCQYCVFYQSVMSGNQLFLLEEWNDEESLQNHLQSDHFRVLRGAMILLKEPYKLTFHTEFHPRDWRRDDEELMDQRPQAGGKGR